MVVFKWLRYTGCIYSYARLPVNSTANSVVQSAAPGSADSTLANLSLDALEDAIGSLSCHLNAATYRLLLLIAELDRRAP